MKNIVLGTWSWGVGAIGGSEVFGNYLGADQLKGVFDIAMKDGMNYWDTAYIYGMGASEEILASFTRPLPRDSYRISTKFTPKIADKNSPDPVGKMLDESLKLFGIEYVDMFWIHHPLDVEKWTPMLIPLVKSGKARKIGVSNHDLAQLKRAAEILAEGGVSISAVQNHYSVLFRKSEKNGVLEWCKKNGADFWAYMVLEQGALTGKYDAEHPLPKGSNRANTYNPMFPKIASLLDLMREIGKKYGVSPAQIAIAWMVAKGATPLIGVTKENQATEAAKAIDVKLSTEEVSALEKAANESGVDTEGAWEKP